MHQCLDIYIPSVYLISVVELLQITDELGLCHT
jgi:hypothetical protein